MKDKLYKLIDLKSIITLSMIFALIFGWFVNKVSTEQFIPLVTMIMTFYFARNKANTLE
ncbi:hypothetical protein [Anaerorhabdus furcosa]|uniref:Uncharacterized protein n=1 Tax=Anaerorhabdus furcosa TaxID=118967 RepID=A0A1T4LSB3_9FIRM|nr:hypothetical protein [Anaerorhabdus furcosa]SJZ57506.1 hypothetical protein SAMN02745191_1016 [Anaerorhabdus furcosa]